jgi:hypothetical protein
MSPYLADSALVDALSYISRPFVWSFLPPTAVLL